MTEKDVRETPPELFAALDAEFHFTLDACADDTNAKLPRYNAESGGFRKPYERMSYVGSPVAAPWTWQGEKVFCNPPFSDIEPWVKKAWASKADSVVMLVPANRTEQPWWQDLVEPHRDNGGPLTVRFLRGRTRFLKDGVRMGSPNFACCLLIWQF